MQCTEAVGSVVAVDCHRVRPGISVIAALLAGDLTCRVEGLADSEVVDDVDRVLEQVQQPADRIEGEVGEKAGSHGRPLHRVDEAAIVEGRLNQLRGSDLADPFLEVANPAEGCNAEDSSIN